MNTLFFNYLLPTSIAIVAFYGVYYFLLRRGSFFVLNRLFLLVALLFSFVLPFAHFESTTPIQQINYTTTVIQPVTNPNPTFVASSTIVENVETPEKSFNWDSFLKTIYIIGIAFMLTRILLQFVRILYLVIKFGIRKENGSSIVFMKNNLPHFSFFKLIFINQNKLNENEEASIIAHEKAHIKQWHCIDLLLLEIATALQWYNPIMWLYKRSLKSIHEYLADQAVLKTGTEKVEYCQLLVKQATGFHIENLTNSFYYPSLKTRILMMTKKHNNRKNIIKICFTLPLFIVLFIFFACNSSKQQVGKAHNTTVDKSALFADATNAQEYPIITGDDLTLTVEYRDTARTQVERSILSSNVITVHSDTTDRDKVYSADFKKIYNTKPDKPAMYKTGDRDIVSYFISTFDFNNWKSKITEATSIQISFYINELGEVTSFFIQFMNGSIVTSSDFPNNFKNMEKWNPATKGGNPIKSTYVFEAGDALRMALKVKGIKVYTVEELMPEIVEFERQRTSNRDHSAVSKERAKSLLTLFIMDRSPQIQVPVEG